MAFKKRQGDGNRPALSVALSVKQGKGYIKGPSFRFWPNEGGGPAFRGTLKDEYLEEVLEFMANAAEANLPVSLALFDNSEQAPKQGGFKKQGGFPPAKKANPFKRQPVEQEQDDSEEPAF